MSPPNIISLARILLVPLVVWLIITGELQLAFLGMLVAGLSDAADGVLAKRFNWTTELGAYLDPLADKLLLVSIFVALGAMHYLPSWVAILVVSRDVMIVVAVVLSWMLGKPLRMHPLMISKINTAAQILLAAFTLANAGFGLGLETALTLLVFVTAALTAASASAYLRTWMRHMNGGPGVAGGGMP